MPKPEKIKIVNDLTEKLKKSKVVLFADFQQLKAAETTSFRNGVRKIAGEVKVAKNTFINLAFKNIGEELEELRGFTGLVLGYEDMLAPAKFLVDFGKDKPQTFKIKGGYLEGKFINTNQVFELAALPGREGLISKMLYVLNSPVSGLVNVLNGPIRGLIQVLKQIEEQKGGSN